MFKNHIICVYKSVPYSGNLINFDDSKTVIKHFDEGKTTSDISIKLKLTRCRCCCRRKMAPLRIVAIHSVPNKLKNGALNLYVTLKSKEAF